VIAIPILSDEHRLVDAYGAPDLLDQASVVAVIIAESGLEDASFVAATRMSEVEHVVRELVFINDSSIRVLQDRHDKAGYQRTTTTASGAVMGQAARQMLARSPRTTDRGALPPDLGAARSGQFPLRRSAAPGKA
jgi:hypothetical protein